MKHVSAAALFLLGLALPAVGQTVSATTGAINGRVTDATGGTLPGVTVTIASSSQMGTRTTVTNQDGGFRFPAVPPGDYNVSFELTGFSKIQREGIRVGLGFTATVNAEMTLASVEETVTVAGQSPVVDTTTTKVTTSFDAEKVANLPGTREYWSLLAATPAVQMQRIDVGGNQAMKTMNLTVYGTNGQHRPVVEGIVSTWGTSLMYYADLGSFAEVAFNPVGNTAEAPTPGVQSQFISKSGGNQYHGSMFFSYQNENFQTRNIDAAQIASGVTGGGGIPAEDTNRILQYRDLGLDVGGYLRKDKLWWYYSYRNLFSDVRFVNLVGTTQETATPSHTAKITHNATKDIRLIGYYNYTDKIHTPAFNSFRVGTSAGIHTPETGWDWLYPTQVYKAEYNHVLSDVGYLELRGGGFYNLWDNDSFAPNQLRFEDIADGRLRGGNRFYDERRHRPQVLGSVSYFNDGWKGTHNLKAGFEVLWDTETDIDGGFPNNLLHILRSDSPLEVYLFESPNTVTSNMTTGSTYLVDTWQFNNRLTLNLGVRFDRYRSFLPEQEHRGGVFSPSTVHFAATDLLTWNNWAPRLGVNYDLTGGGKTVLKFSTGSYWWTPSTDLARSLNPNQAFWFRRYAWTDPNRNGVWDPGEQGSLLQTSGGVASETVDPNLENSYTREAMAFLEHEVAANFGIRTGFVWRGERNRRRQVNLNQPYDSFTVPVPVRDPGPDGVPGTGDDGGTITAFNLSPQYLGRPTVNLTQNVPDAQSDFYTWEVTGNRRMNRGWSLVAGFSHTWNNSSVIPLNPNDLINRPGGIDESTTWTAKISSTIELPQGFRVSPLMRHQAGQPFGRTFVASLNYGNPTLLAEPINARRTRNVTVVDLRVEKGINVGGRRLAGFFDLYNVANANPETTLGTTSGASYLRPLDIIPPRVARIGMKFDW